MFPASSSFRARSAFTLVEIMIVVVVIGLLAAIALPAVAKARQAAQNNRFVNDLRQVRDALYTFSLDRGNYPAETSAATAPNGLNEYLRTIDWSQPNSLGGRWDYEFDANGPSGLLAGVATVGATVDATQIAKIDQRIDDGDLASGYFKGSAGNYIYLLE